MNFVSYLRSVIIVCALMLAGSLQASATLFDDDFVYVDTTSSVIAQLSPVATPGIAWQFELRNQSTEPLYVLVRQAGITLVPDEVSGSDARVDSGFLRLPPAMAVRLAGLNMSEPLALVVVKKDELPDLLDTPLENTQQEVARSIRRDAIVKAARFQGRIRNDIRLQKNKTLIFT